MTRRTMKSKPPRYPNAADRRYYLDKLLNGILAIVTGLGAFITLLFFIML